MKKVIGKILFTFSILIVTGSFAIPIIDVVWVLPGTDGDGHEIFTTVHNYYSVFGLFSAFDSGPFSIWLIMD